MRNLVVPNEQANNGQRLALWVAYGSLLALVYSAWKPHVFPSLSEVLASVRPLIAQGLIDELLTSLMTNLEALLLSAMLGLPLAYLSRLPVAEPLAAFVGNLRFVGAAVFFLPLLFLMPSQHALKLGLLTLAELFSLVTTMTGVVRSLEQWRYDDATTLRMGPWRQVWWVNVRATVPQAIAAIRDNAAMGWASLMFVESLVRSEGGIGVMLLNQQRYGGFNAGIWTIIAVILLTGALQDYVLTLFKRIAAPYAD